MFHVKIVQIIFCNLFLKAQFLQICSTYDVLIIFGDCKSITLLQTPYMPREQPPDLWDHFDSPLRNVQPLSEIVRINSYFATLSLHLFTYWYLIHTLLETFQVLFFANLSTLLHERRRKKNNYLTAPLPQQ
jgi:hypothetical protein